MFLCWFGIHVVFSHLNFLQSSLIVLVELLHNLFLFPWSRYLAVIIIFPTLFSWASNHFIFFKFILTLSGEISSIFMNFNNFFCPLLESLHQRSFLQLAQMNGIQNIFQFFFINPLANHLLFNFLINLFFLIFKLHQPWIIAYFDHKFLQDEIIHQIYPIIRLYFPTAGILTF